MVFPVVSETPSTTPRLITVQLTDSFGAASVVRTRTVAVTSVNDAPVVTIPSTALTYVENGASLPLFNGATIVDPDLANTVNTTAVLKVTNTTGDSNDRIQILPSGVYTVANNVLKANGVTIATFTGGAGTTPLVVNFTHELRASSSCHGTDRILECLQCAVRGAESGNRSVDGCFGGDEFHPFANDKRYGGE